MTTAYIITNPLRLYSEKGFFSSTSEAKQLRTISLAELARSIPTDQITIYFSAETAKAHLQTKGYGTPLILKVELEKLFEPNSGETQFTTDWNSIDKDPLIEPDSKVTLLATGEDMSKMPAGSFSCLPGSENNDTSYEYVKFS